MAPFTPFLSEELYQKLTGDESVHLLDWPENSQVDKKVLEDMQFTRKVIEYGLMLRMQKDEAKGEEQRKVRQPLSRLSYAGSKLGKYYESIIEGEVNVKKVEFEDRNEDFWVEIEKKLTPELKREGLMREVIRFVQSGRKKADLNVDDRIKLSLKTSGELEEAIKEHRTTITDETLAVSLSEDEYSYKEIVKVEGQELVIFLERA